MLTSMSGTLRTVARKKIPYLVAGMGGYYNLPGLKPGKRPIPPQTPLSGKDASGNPLTLESYNDTMFGFLRITVSPDFIVGEFVTVDPASGKTGVGDRFTLDLHANTVSTGVSRTTAAKGGTTSRSKASGGTSGKAGAAK